MRFFSATTVPAEAVSNAPAPARVLNPVLPYVAPFVALLAAMMATAALSAGFDWLYPVRVLVVVPVFWLFRREYATLTWRWSWEAAAVGVGVFLAWLGLELGLPHVDAGPTLVSRLDALAPQWKVIWLVFRVVGSVVIVPVVEELAFRGYLTRRLISADVGSVPLGQFSWFSFVTSSVLFGALHGRWLAGILAGVAYALVFYRRRCLVDAIVAHAVTNGLIAATVLLGGQWGLWA
jgi:CAAX prenyl protease-like protein